MIGSFTSNGSSLMRDLSYLHLLLYATFLEFSSPSTSQSELTLPKEIDRLRVASMMGVHNKMKGLLVICSVDNVKMLGCR